MKIETKFEIGDTVSVDRGHSTVVEEIIVMYDCRDKNNYLQGFAEEDLTLIKKKPEPCRHIYYSQEFYYSKEFYYTSNSVGRGLVKNTYCPKCGEEIPKIGSFNG